MTLGKTFLYTSSQNKHHLHPSQQRYLIRTSSAFYQLKPLPFKREIHSTNAHY